jgi:LysM repeat protein
VARKYRYKTFKKRRKHNAGHFIVAVIVIVIVVLLLIKFRDHHGGSVEPDLPETAGALPQQPDEQQPDLPESPENQISRFQPDDVEPVETKPVKTELVESETLESESVAAEITQIQPDTSQIEQPIPEQPEPDEIELIDPEAKALIAEALQDVNAGNIIAARDKLNQTLAMGLSPQIVTSVKAQMANLSEKWLFSRDAMPGDVLTELYEVQSGDLLSTIGSEFKIPHEILQQINNISRPESLQIGQKIKVINGPFHTIVYRSTFTMDLYLQNTYVKTYSIGLGTEDKETPTGKWCVKAGGKLIKPTWTDPETGRTYIADDPDYPLGSRWIALEGLEGNAEGRTGFAIHGTKDPETIGTRSSRGCIRLFNGDAIELYNLVIPVQSKINVVD